MRNIPQDDDLNPHRKLLPLKAGDDCVIRHELRGDHVASRSTQAKYRTEQQKSKGQVTHDEGGVCGVWFVFGSD